MKKIIIFALLFMAAFANAQTAMNVKSVNRIQYASQQTGTTIQQRILNGCLALNGARGKLIIEGWNAAGWSNTALPTNCSVEDHRLNPGFTGTAFTGGVSYYNRFTSVPAGLVIPSNLLLELDAFSGGKNDIFTTKTQWQAIRAQLYCRTLGECKGFETDVRGFAMSDTIGGMLQAYCWGGHGTGGDEGCEGLRASIGQAFGASSVPTGTITAIDAPNKTVTASWSAGTNAYLGESRFFIDTTTGVYSTGTLTSSSGTSPNCTIVGTGTAWAATFGAGDKTDLALEYIPLTVGAARYVIPINHVTDATHLNIDFVLAEVGNSCLTITPGSSYRIFHGGQVTALTTPPSGIANATGFIASGVTFSGQFIVGDAIEEVLGYNYHGTGATLVTNDIFPDSSYGLEISNIGARLHDAIFTTGDATNGLRFGGNYIGPLINGSSASYASLFQSFNTSAVNQSLIYLLTTGGASSVEFDYNRPNNYWLLGGLRLAGDGSGYGFGTNPIPGEYVYMYYNNAASDGLILAPAAIPNVGKHIFDTQVAGVSRFQIDNAKVSFNNSIHLFGWNGNFATQKWDIDSSNGNANFVSMSIGSGGFTSTTSLNTFGVVHANSIIAPQIVAGMNNNVFSATPTFDCSIQSGLEVTLTGNMTAMTVSNCTVGQIITFVIHQDGAGAHTWAWPASFKGADAIGATANKTNIQQFIPAYDGNYYAIAPAKTNM